MIDREGIHHASHRSMTANRVVPEAGFLRLFRLPPQVCTRLFFLFAIAAVLLAPSSLPSQQIPQPRDATHDPTVALLMHNAVVAAEHGNGDQALHLVSTILVQHPGYVPALKLQGVLLEASGNQSDAAQSFNAALKLAPGDPELQLKVGVVELVQGHAKQAVELLQKYVKSAPDDDEGLFYLAQAYHRNGDDAQALATIGRAAKLAPENAAIAQKYGELLCSSGDNTEGLRQLLRAQQAEPDLPRIQYDLAFASYNNQDLEQAVAYATKATVQQPTDIDAFALLASTRVKLAQWQDAEPLLQLVLRARPSDAGVLLQLGHTELELKQYQLAVDTLTQALQTDPTQALAHFFLARAYTGLGKRDEARHESELHARMMQEFSFDAPAGAQQHEAELTEQARNLLAVGKEEQAVQLFLADSKQAHGTEAAAYLGVGATYLRMNNIVASQRALRRALALDPKIKGAYTYLGFIALEQNDLPAADRALQAEIQGDPNHPEALAEMGEVRYRQSRWEEAALFLVRSKNGSPRFLYMLTDSYYHLGNIEAANLTAESLAAHAHNQTEVLHSLGELLRRNNQPVLAARLVP